MCNHSHRGNSRRKEECIPWSSARLAPLKCMRLYTASLCEILLVYLHCQCGTRSMRGPGSSVGIATDYGLDGPGSNPGGEEIFRSSRPVLGPTQPPIKWVPGLSRG